MTTAHPPTVFRSSPLLSAIVAGGLLAGTLDGISAFITFGWKMPYGIASGVLGSKAIAAAAAGSVAVWVLGLALHYTIALGAAATYGLSSRRLTFLREHFLVGGVLAGIATYLVMNLVVLPLSAVPFPVGPFSVSAIRSALGFQIALVGLPISVCLWFFNRRARARAA